MRCSMQGSGRLMTYIELLTGDRFAVRDCVRLPDQLDSISRLKAALIDIDSNAELSRQSGEA